MTAWSLEEEVAWQDREVYHSLLPLRSHFPLSGMVGVSVAWGLACWEIAEE